VSPGAAAWADAALAAALLAIAPSLGGACLRARSGPAQQAWLDLYLRLAPDRAALRLPPGIADERLFGGLDLAATLAAGRPVMSPGLLAEAADRVFVLPMAERAGSGLAARLGNALDAGGSFTLVALDEGAEDDEMAPPALRDRLAFLPRLDAVAAADLASVELPDPAAVAAARARLADVAVPGDFAESLAGAALALGIGSLRAPLLALTAARAAAALAGAPGVDAEAARIAARLVLGPRARQMPESAEEEPEPPQEAPEPPPDAPHDQPEGADEEQGETTIPEEILLEPPPRRSRPTCSRGCSAPAPSAAPAPAATARAAIARRGAGAGRPAACAAIPARARGST
jgi:magnesium chelatase subunit D